MERSWVGEVVAMPRLPWVRMRFLAGVMTRSLLGVRVRSLVEPAVVMVPWLEKSSELVVRVAVLPITREVP